LAILRLSMKLFGSHRTVPCRMGSAQRRSLRLVQSLSMPCFSSDQGTVGSMGRRGFSEAGLLAGTPPPLAGGDSGWQ
jgi:hypothetical protein